MIRRVNITIDGDLHEKAKAHAKTVHFTDFSGLITKLIVDDLRAEAILQAKSLPAPPQTVAVPGGEVIKAGASAEDGTPIKRQARRRAG